MGMCELVMRLSKVQLNQIRSDSDKFWELRNQWRDTDHCIDLDKMWQGIHYLFNFSAWEGSPPAKWIIFGDSPIPSFDGGYGPARYLKPSQVSEVLKLLDNTSEEELKKRYDPNEFSAASIYPAIWMREKEEAYEDLIYFYRQLKSLYQKAVDAGEHVLMVII